MAAIDKIYLNSYNEYIEFRDWLKAQPKIKDKYGKEISLMTYFFDYWDKESWFDKNGKNVSRPVYSAPYFIDAYIIRNCPIEGVQKELMFNYGHKTQEDLREIYDTVKNRKPEIQKVIDEAKGDFHKFPTGIDVNEFVYWYWNINDFNIDENGIISIKGTGKSDYEMIKDDELYTSPSCNKYERGKHFRITKIPTIYKGHKCNYPIPYKKHTPSWFIDVKLPDYVEEKYMSWSSHSSAKFPIGSWDFISEYVISYDNWASSCTNCKSIRALTRRITRWNLPIGTIINVTGRCVGEEYEIIVKK